MKADNISISFINTFLSKLKDVSILYKVRLGSLVIFSSVIGYLIAASGSADTLNILILAIGGFLVTSASNAINQIFEKDVDILMDRTKNRPIPAGRMSSTEALLYAGVAAVVGLVLITYFFNPIAGLLSAVALISYAFIYTPMKRYNSFAVFVGSIPGALPPMIGVVAFDGYISTWAIFLFAVQFIWQFPHFWAIAWVAFDDYKKANIMLLPSNDGKCKNSAIITFIYSLFLIPMGALGYYIELIDWKGTFIITLAAFYFSYFAYKLLIKLDDKHAKKLMFASFIYLPIALLALLFDKI